MAELDRERDFRRVVLENVEPVSRFLARRIYPLSPSALDDLVSETLVVAWRRFDTMPRDAETAWLIGVAKNVLNNARRARWRRLRMEKSLRAVNVQPSAESQAIASEVIRSALSELSDPDREILLMHNWDGLDAKALAVVLAITPEAAETRLTRAHRRFKEAVQSDASVDSKSSASGMRRHGDAPKEMTP